MSRDVFLSMSIRTSGKILWVAVDWRAGGASTDTLSN